jgi:hypothetical protein
MAERRGGRLQRRGRRRRRHWQGGRVRRGTCGGRECAKVGCMTADLYLVVVVVGAERARPFDDARANLARALALPGRGAANAQRTISNNTRARARPWCKSKGQTNNADFKTGNSVHSIVHAGLATSARGSCSALALTAHLMYSTSGAHFARRRRPSAARTRAPKQQFATIAPSSQLRGVGSVRQSVGAGERNVTHGRNF